MSTLRRHFGTIWFVGIVLVVFLMFAVASGTPYFKWFRVLFSLALVILTARAWRERGREWLPALSWAIPLAILWTVGQYLVDRPLTLVVFIYWLGLGAVLVMLVSTRAARWWYEVLLRRPFRG